jgi:DNA replication protein DnaC
MEVFSQRYKRGSIIITSNLPFEGWASLIAEQVRSVFRRRQTVGNIMSIPILGELHHPCSDLGFR